MIAYLLASMPFAIAFLMALLIVALIATATVNPWAPLLAIYSVFILDTALMFPLALKLGVWIYPADLAALIFFAALIIRLAFFGASSAIPLFWWILGGIQAILFSWGLIVNGSAAGVDYRPHFYVWVGAAYLATFGYNSGRARRILALLLPLAAGLTAVAAYRWIMGAIDWQFQRELDRYITTEVSFRVIWSGATFMIAMAMLTAFHRAFAGRRQAAYWLWALGFAVVVLVLQHRSVWAAALGGVIGLTMLHLRRHPGRASTLTASLLALAFVVALGFLQVGSVSESVRTQAARALSTHEGTFAGRVVGWQALLTDWVASRSLPTYLIGKPYGSGYTRHSSSFGGAEVGYSPHNFYVQLLYRGGILGLLSFGWFAFTSLRTLFVLSRQGDDTAMLLAAMMVSLLVYYIPYGMTYEQILPIGLALAVVSQLRREAHISRQGIPVRKAANCLRATTLPSAQP